MSRMGIGKIPNSVLKRIVLSQLGVSDPEVLVGPGIGEDAAIISHCGGKLAFKSDPITGSVEEVGFLAVYVNANDIASRGAVPRWFLGCILLPPGSSESDLDRICKQIDSAAKELGIAVVGGHTEVTDGTTRPIVVGSMIGVTKNSRFITTGGSSPGDSVYMTKTAGIEGTVILSSEPRLEKSLGEGFVKRCKSMLPKVNVVSECMLLADQEGVTSMHDVTEGGILGCAWEIAEASSSGILIDLSYVRVLEETRLLCAELGLDPFRLMGSGSVLFTVRAGCEASVEKSLSEAGIPHSRIGVMRGLHEGRQFRDLDGRLLSILPPGVDELWRARTKG
ncbi:MAG: AIR synthase family protein [Candidatus Methanosuratincola sp.]|jgi:hydrogenase maturation factor|nr:AIR synthase family protein [Candidatus Methanosuratincola sp.]